MVEGLLDGLSTKLGSRTKLSTMAKVGGGGLSAVRVQFGHLVVVPPPPPCASKQQNTELCCDDHAPVTRGRMRGQYLLPHGPCASTALSMHQDLV